MGDTQKLAEWLAVVALVAQDLLKVVASIDAKYRYLCIGAMDEGTEKRTPEFACKELERDRSSEN